jgi:methanol--5-hydroxybenzimidazolylcobamide Co-methyltransferase
VGPGKDCGYENPFLKVITGLPMAMEGKTAACAHLSPLGNIASAAADTWSNESVQNVRLLGSMAPTCYLEQLIYDCRLMNQALQDGKTAALTLRKWLVNSDAALDPQAYILTPASTIAIAQAIIDAPDHYQAGRAAGLAAVRLLREGQEQGLVKIPQREQCWLPLLQNALEDLPDNQEAFIRQQMAQVDTTKFVAADYLL